MEGDIERDSLGGICRERDIYGEMYKEMEWDIERCNRLHCVMQCILVHYTLYAIHYTLYSTLYVLYSVLE